MRYKNIIMMLIMINNKCTLRSTDLAAVDSPEVLLSHLKTGDCCLFITMDIMSMETFPISYRMIIFSMESLGDKIR